MSCLVVGLGNPGKQYENNRHNFGFLVLREFARIHGWSLSKGWRIKGELGHGSFAQQTVRLLLPSTYMNVSGKALVQMMGYYKVDIERVLVVVDDIYLPFGEIRIRPEGGSGGHNGLKSIEQALGTKHYARLKMGIGDREDLNKPLEAHVLENFSRTESEKLPELIKRGAALIESWIEYGIEESAKLASSFKKLE